MFFGCEDDVNDSMNIVAVSLWKSDPSPGFLRLNLPNYPKMLRK
uniref:Uncharacterized protein n=1 Tax=Meloidogyne enterolobii TaxID=390850 RepID=A0A6V7VNW3_MELEN|nr:unnamed protein product [Meloidogyne enterolobii]